MKRIKMSLMALVFLCTAGISYATTASEKAAPNDCSLTGTAPGTLDSEADCPTGSTILCCVLIDGSFTQIFKRP